MKTLAEYFRDREIAKETVRRAVRKQLRTGHVVTPEERLALLRRIMRRMGV